MKPWNTQFEFDERLDALTIYREHITSVPIAGSISFANFIFDIGTDGSFVSLEIDNASEALDISKKDLNNIKNARIISYVRGNIIYLSYTIELGKQTYHNSYMIPKDKISLTA